MEAAYRPKGKGEQVAKKKTYIKQNNSIIGAPDLQIYTGIVYYTPLSLVKMRTKSYDLEYVIGYKRLSSRMLEQFSKKDIKDLVGLVRDNEDNKKLLADVIRGADADALATIMKDFKSCKGYSAFRGRIAEVMVFKDIMRELPAGVNFFPNIALQYGKNMKSKTELDGMLTFYGPEKFVQLLKNMDEYDSVSIRMSDGLKKYC